MTRKQEVANYLLNNQTATNQEVAETLEISESNAKRIISNLKTAGAIVVKKNNGERNIEVDMSKINSKVQSESLNRKEYVQQMIDLVFDSLENESQIENIINAGYLIVKLIDRL